MTNHDKRGETLRASVIIAAYNRRDDVGECLDELTGHELVPERVEVIVIDDASTDGTADLIKASYPHVRLFVNERNLGPACARNRGAREARGGLLIFLDSDAVPSSAWLEAMLAHDDGATLLTGRVTDFEGTRVQIGPRRATFLGKSLPCAPDRANTGGSGNLAIPRSVFLEIGGFDEEIPFYFEDSFLCIRARKAGLKAKYLADAVVRHKGRGVKEGMAVWMQEHNSTYAMLKHYRGNLPAMALFLLLNTLWALLRIVTLALRMRPTDSRRIFSGCRSACARFFFGVTPPEPF